MEPEAKTPLARLIDEKGFRKGWVAEKLGMSAPSFSRLVTGERRMTLEEAVQLAELLGVSERELLADGGVG